jgi:hypothetical protein
MGNPFRWARPLCILLLSSALSWGVSFAQSPTPESDSRYFPETGHFIKGNFKIAYESAIDPARIYGYPITEAFVDSTGNMVQYFEKTVLEEHPENPPELRIRPRDLGEFQHPLATGSPLPVPSNFPACRVFPEDPHKYRVCYSFLDFYIAYGGPAQFGYPVSNFELLDGRIVQSFQRARFEWHPELASGNRVVLADLGRIEFANVGENPRKLEPVRGDNIPRTVLSLRVRAFPKTAFTSRTDTQTIYIVVQDQNRVPVENAQVTLTVTLPSGKVDRYVVNESTDQNGVTSLSFDYKGEIVGAAQVLITAKYIDKEQQTTTSFRIWW